MTNKTTMAALQDMLSPEKRKIAVGLSASSFLKLVPKVKCKNGFSVSIQASAGHYCAPRDNEGPWRKVELGYPSDRVETWLPYIDGDEDSDPTASVYAFVPIELVAEAIDAHGGLSA